MPKIIVLGGDYRKKITVSKSLLKNLDWADVNPREIEMFDNIELVSRNYDSGGNDLIFAFDDVEGRSAGTLYIGHFNDGVV